MQFWGRVSSVVHLMIQLQSRRFALFYARRVQVSSGYASKGRRGLNSFSYKRNMKLGELRNAGRRAAKQWRRRTFSGWVHFLVAIRR